MSSDRFTTNGSGGAGNDRTTSVSPPSPGDESRIFPTESTSKARYNLATKLFNLDVEAEELLENEAKEIIEGADVQVPQPPGGFSGKNAKEVAHKAANYFDAQIVFIVSYYQQIIAAGKQALQVAKWREGDHRVASLAVLPYRFLMNSRGKLMKFKNIRHLGGFWLCTVLFFLVALFESHSISNLLLKNAKHMVGESYFLALCTGFFAVTFTTVYLCWLKISFGLNGNRRTRLMLVLFGLLGLVGVYYVFPNILLGEKADAMAQTASFQGGFSVQSETMNASESWSILKPKFSKVFLTIVSLFCLGLSNSFLVDLLTFSHNKLFRTSVKADPGWHLIDENWRKHSVVVQNLIGIIKFSQSRLKLFPAEQRSFVDAAVMSWETKTLNARLRQQAAAAAAAADDLD